MLLALLLVVALLSIGVMTEIERIDFQIKRDREEELVHRGVQYSRAVKKFYRKFGRYPTKIEDLESTNTIRFLRKRYKDPITGKPFKMLHLTDVQMAFGNNGPGVPASQLVGNSEDPGSPGALSNNGPVASGAGPTAIVGQNPPADAPSDATQADQAVVGAGTPPPPQPLSQQAGPNGAPQVFGGTGIVGVASVSKDKTIREYNKKNHYNQWQFIYDPTMDRGGLLMTPSQPPLLGATNANVGNLPLNSPGMNPGMNNGGFGGNNNGLGGSPSGPGQQGPSQHP